MVSGIDHHARLELLDAADLGGLLSSIVRFLWMTPMPPFCAMAMAMGASVTVSIAAEISGMFRVISRVSRVRVSVTLVGQSLGIGRHDEDVVEGQGFRDSRVSRAMALGPFIRDLGGVHIVRGRQAGFAPGTEQGLNAQRTLPRPWFCSKASRLEWGPGQSPGLTS